MKSTLSDLFVILLSVLIIAPSALFAASREKIWAQSPQYDADKKIFVNQVPGDINQGMDFWPMLKAYIFGGEIRTPSVPLPTIKPDWESFKANDGEALKWIWLGHSGLFLNLRGTLILIDTVLASAAAPLPFLVPRFQAPVCSYEDLPTPDIILISHDHYDHLDEDLIRHFAPSSAQFVVPLAVGQELEDLGINPERIRELDWYQEITIADLTLIAAPAQHFSGRGLLDRFNSLWASWILKSGDLQIFFSGDSGYAPHFKEINRRYGAFQLAFLDCGQYDKNWMYVHMMPSEVLQAAQDLQAAAIAPVHWGVFSLAMHDWFEPIERISELAELAGIPLWHPKQGELIRLRSKPTGEAWWRDHPDFVKRQVSALGEP